MTPGKNAQEDWINSSNFACRGLMHEVYNLFLPKPAQAEKNQRTNV